MLPAGCVHAWEDAFILTLTWAVYGFTGSSAGVDGALEEVQHTQPSAAKMGPAPAWSISAEFSALFWAMLRVPVYIYAVVTY